MPPNLPGKCVEPECEENHEPGRFFCAAHIEAWSRCKHEGCDEPHYSGGFCREHQGHAVEDEEQTIVIKKNGEPTDLAGAREWFARRMEILGAEIGAELRNIGRIAHWEQERNRDVEE